MGRLRLVREASALVYDAARQRTLLVGGLGPGGALGDAWEWDGRDWARWSFPASPAARSGHATAYDSLRNRVVLAGGLTAAGQVAEIWELPGAFRR